eukprot:gene7764-8575_t
MTNSITETELSMKEQSIVAGLVLVAVFLAYGTVDVSAILDRTSEFANYWLAEWASIELCKVDWTYFSLLLAALSALAYYIKVEIRDQASSVPLFHRTIIGCLSAVAILRMIAVNMEAVVGLLVAFYQPHLLLISGAAAGLIGGKRYMNKESKAKSA